MTSLAAHAVRADYELIRHAHDLANDIQKYDINLHFIMMSKRETREKEQRVDKESNNLSGFRDWWTCKLYVIRR